MISEDQDSDMFFKSLSSTWFLCCFVANLRFVVNLRAAFSTAEPMTIAPKASPGQHLRNFSSAEEVLP